MLDPIFSLRRCIRIQPHETVRVSFSTAVAHSHEEALRLADKYHDPSIFEREAALAWTHSQVEMRHLNIDPENAYLFQRLAARHFIFRSVSLRPRPNVFGDEYAKRNRFMGLRHRRRLADRAGSNQSRRRFARRFGNALNAHEYLRFKGLMFDLVILNEHPEGYIQSLQDELLNSVRDQRRVDICSTKTAEFS